MHQKQKYWVNSALHPFGVGKSSTGLSGWVKAGSVHLCEVAGNTGNTNLYHFTTSRAVCLADIVTQATNRPHNGAHR